MARQHEFWSPHRPEGERARSRKPKPSGEDWLGSASSAPFGQGNVPVSRAPSEGSCFLRHLGCAAKSDIDEYGGVRFFLHEVTDYRTQSGSFGEFNVIVFQHRPNPYREVVGGVAPDFHVPTADGGRQFGESLKRGFDGVRIDVPVGHLLAGLTGYCAVSFRRAVLVTTGSMGTSLWGPRLPVFTPAMLSTTSMPSTTLPNTA